jgi:hypothetical protein
MSKKSQIYFKRDKDLEPQIGGACFLAMIAIIIGVVIYKVIGG